MIRPACLAAFARDLAHAAALGSVVAAVADWATEAKHLRARVAELEAENDALADMVNDLAGQLAKAVKHPCASRPADVTVARVELVNLDEVAAALGIDLDADDPGPITTGEMADGMALLDRDDLEVGDLLHEWGGEVQ